MKNTCIFKEINKFILKKPIQQVISVNALAQFPGNSVLRASKLMFTWGYRFKLHHTEAH